MSLPTFPTNDPPLTREESVNQIISSIAMEEVALSHIINAEGEKLQYILGTLTGSTGLQPTIDQVLEVNKSVTDLLQAASETQSLLRTKLQTALASAVLYGPTGPTGATGPTGPATIDVDTDVIKLEPDDQPYVIVGGTSQDVELQFAIPRGATGATGPQGEIGPTGYAATITAEMAQRVPFDDNPTVVNIGDEHNAQFVFGIPDGMPGATGATGATGERGPAALVLPFSAGKYGMNLITDQNGIPHVVSFNGFSSTASQGIMLHEGEWTSGELNLSDNSMIPTCFIMPRDGTIKSIYALVNPTTTRQLDQDVVIQPFVCIATSQNSVFFTVEQSTMINFATYQGTIYMHTVHKASLEDIDLFLPQGTVVAIISGISSVNGQYAYADFGISGGIHIE